MSEERPFIKRIITKPPQLFPWVALFHLIMLGYSIWNYRTQPFPSVDWIQPLWMLMYTVSWVFACDLKKWGALLYVVLTSANLVLRFTLGSYRELDIYTDALFPVDVLFSFFILFYYKHFR